jgi:hypothetical protein
MQRGDIYRKLDVFLNPTANPINQLLIRYRRTPDQRHRIQLRRQHQICAGVLQPDIVTLQLQHIPARGQLVNWIRAQVHVKTIANHCSGKGLNSV